MSLYKVLAVIATIVAVGSALPVQSFTASLESAQKGVKNGGSLWAVLVAGSSGYENYRHQADICHAYQILHSHGVPDSNIIVMMYDDIAKSSSNPDKGSIINEPNGPNVYPGVLKDYTKGDVKPKYLLDILSGNADGVKGVGSGRVVNSTADDHIFLYFADHGAPGLIAFPNHYLIIPQSLSAKDLMNTLKGMHSANKYNKMTIYIEACESGSMFAGILPADMNIYAVTAANPHQSSYACYHDNHLGTYLGDCFSNHWMEDTDNATADGTFNTRTLQQQYSNVAAVTTTSVVCQYGDTSLSSLPIQDFVGTGAVSASAKRSGGKKETNSVSSRDVELAILHQAVQEPRDEEHLEWATSKLEKIAARRSHLSDLFKAIIENAGADVMSAYKVKDDASCDNDSTLSQLDCTNEAYHMFGNVCGGIDESFYTHARALHHLCKVTSADRVMDAIKTECKNADLVPPFVLYDRE